MKNKKNAVIAIIGMLVVPFVFFSSANAEVLMGDHFDSQPDWNSSQNADLLDIWSGVQMANRGGSKEAAYISSIGAHGESGKGFIQYWDKTTSMGSAQDIWLMKNNINFPNEWYLGYWFQVDPLWDWGSAANLKLLKVHFNSGDTWDIYWTAFCAGCPDWGVPAGAERSLCTDEWGRNWAGRWSDLGSDWHYFIWHFNHSEGILELFVDGQLAMQTDYTTNFPGSGWESAYGISFGGNIMDGGGGVSEMWTKYDDIVIATTKSEVESFLGVSSSLPEPENPVSVLLSESFDNNNLADRGWYDGGSTSAIVVFDSDRSSNVLEINYLSGNSISEGSQIRHLFTETEEICVTYSVKYDSNWSWTGENYGPHEFYLLTNKDHDWKGPAYSHSTFYMEMTGGIPRIAHQDAMNIDTSHINEDISGSTESRAVCGCNGALDGYSGVCYQSGDYWYNGRMWNPPSFTPISVNKWYTVKVYFKLNDISNDKGVANGVLKYWLDGNLLMSYNDVIFRTAENADMKFRHLLFGPYFHDGAPNDQKFWIDDILIQDGISTPLLPPIGLMISP